MVEADKPTSGGGSNPLPSLTDYLDPEADTLLGRVDFAGMVGAIFRGWVLGIFSVLIGVSVAIRRSLGGLYEDVTAAGGNVWTTLLAFPQRIQEGAVDAAAQQLPQFGIIAGPVSQGVLLAGMLAVAFVIVVLAFGGDG